MDGDEDTGGSTERVGEIIQEEIAGARTEGFVEGSNAALDAAQHQIDAAQRQAEEIAAAAMQTELGRRVGAMEEEHQQWRRNEELRSTEHREAMERLAALSLLTPPQPSEPPPEPEPQPEPQPEPKQPESVEENPAPSPAQSTRRGRRVFL